MRYLVSLVLLIGVLLLGSSIAPPPVVANVAHSPISSLQIVRIHTTHATDAQLLINQGIDLLEMRSGAYLFAIVTAQQEATLRSAGWDVSVDKEQTALLQRQSSHLAFSSAYHTVEETEQFLRDMADQYPHLTALEDYGDSWERQQSAGDQGYDLLALRITNKETPGPKPVFFLIGNIHAREIVSSEIAIRFISYLLERYDTDPDITWMLNEHEVVVAPITNPDGKKWAEQGYMQRKNTNKGNGVYCVDPPSISNQAGVDLNRNFSYQWGTVAEPTLSPCNVTFPGTSAGSEPETQAIQQLSRSLFPDHPSPADGKAAPDDTSGVFITLHSYSDLVLWPWGYSNNPSPNAAGLQQLGTKMATFNGYQPAQSIQLYPTSGTTDDWVYSELGIASYTFEIGPAYGECGGFMPSYECLDQGGSSGNFWQRNLPALLYATQVARAPYTQPAGPTIQEMAVVSDTQALTLTAIIVHPDQNIAQAEAFVETSRWQGGTSFPLIPLDGAFDAPVEQAQVVIPSTQISATTQTTSSNNIMLLSHAAIVTDNWGTMRATWVPTTTATSAQIPAVQVVTDTTRLTMTIDFDGGEQLLDGAEAYIGVPPWDGGSPIALQSIDGSFDSVQETAHFTTTIAQLKEHTGYDTDNQRLLVIVRSHSSDDTWNPMRVVWLSLGTPKADEPSYTVWLPVLVR